MISINTSLLVNIFLTKHTFSYKMSRVPARSFQTAASRAINYIGNVSVTDVVQMNEDAEWENALDSASSKVEAEVSQGVQSR